MKFRFTETIFSEGERSFIKVPFNVWEETGLKGNLPCSVSVSNISFECRLLPKGGGNYFIPIKK